MSEAKSDHRQLTLDDNEAEIRAAVEALGPGEALVLVGEDPRELVGELEEEAPGRLEWSLLEESPERTRLEVRRRATEGPRSVTEYLQGDHKRLDALLVSVERHTDAGSFAEAQARFAEFACGLNWHINVEEQLVFPLFEAKTGMTQGPTTVMREEHKDIRERIQGVITALATSTAAPVHDAIGKLTMVLGAHNLKEERMLYPMTDRAIETFEAQERIVCRIAKF